MNPQQEMFDELVRRIKALGYDVYDGVLPPEGVQYPVVCMGESQQTDAVNKAAVFGSVHQTIRVWHNNAEERVVLSSRLLEVKQICKSIRHTANFAWDIRKVENKIILDNTTNIYLLQGVLEVEYKFN